MPERRFVILSLPRSGSTSMARLLNCHQDIRCIVEPFHPHRYGGKLFQLATQGCGIDRTLELIWKRWNGIKHVWESSGWPFESSPELNYRIVRASDICVIFIIRRNLLRRVLSTYIGRHTGYWIGTRGAFVERFHKVRFEAPDPESVRRQVLRDKIAIDRQLLALRRHSVQFMTVDFEDVFRPEAKAEERHDLTNGILKFLEYTPVPLQTFVSEWHTQFDPTLHRWASPEVYSRIPGIEEVEARVGCYETGWLFQ